MSSKDDSRKNLLNNKSCRDATEETVDSQAPVSANAHFPRQVPLGMELRLSGKCSAYWAISPSSKHFYFQPLHATYAPRVGRLGKQDYSFRFSKTIVLRITAPVDLSFHCIN